MTIRVRGLLLAFIACSMQGGLAFAAKQPAPSPLREKSFRHPGLNVPELAQQVKDLGELAPGLKQELASLGISDEYGFYDSRAGRWASLMLSTPLVPGKGVGNGLSWGKAGMPDEQTVRQQVWDAVRTYVDQHQGTLRVDLDELAASPRIGIFEKGSFIVVHAPRMIRGIAVRDSGLTAVINHGNLVLLGLQNWGDMPPTATAAAAVGGDKARGTVAAHARPSPVAGFLKEPYLELIPTLNGDAYAYRLAWVVRAAMADDSGSWEGLVDAHTGELFAFEDRAQYVARKIVGGVYPVSNDQRPPDGIEQSGWPMPYANVVVGGNTLFTNSGGSFGCATGNATTSLNGSFVRMVDVCGPASESSAVGDIDLGFGPTPDATDCVVPPGHSVGDTKSSRSGFYELNRIIEQAKGYLPNNPWLHSTLIANMNIDDECNATWNGTVNFFKSSPDCRNTGEIAAIFDHEWGHGMDNNGVNATISSPGEAIADIHAFLRLNNSCTGRGFFKNQVCTGYGDGCDGTPLTGCTGVRDLDFMNHRCNLPHTISWVRTGFTTAQCPGGAPACPAGGGTPCGGETHCEGMVAAETGWDLHFRDLRAAPFSFDENTALELATRLSFLGSQALTGWYGCAQTPTPCQVAGTCGCGATNGYPLFLAADDDNGNLADGTPHIEAIRNAFQRHEIACTTPAAGNSGCAGGPNTAPVVVATPLDQGVSLSWGAVPNAASYAIYRTEGVAGCSFGKVRVGETTGTTFVDQNLQNGRTYYYSVWPVGSNPSCFGLMSSCVTVVPAPGPNLGFQNVSSVVPAGVGGDGDTFVDNCESATATFTVENTGTGPLTNVRLVSVTPLTHPSTTITTPLPAPIAATLTDCATAMGTFNFVPQGMTFGQTTQLRIQVTADEIFPQTRTMVVSAVQVESDAVPVASRTYNFDTDMSGWTTTSGTFVRATPGALATSHHLTSSAALPDQCDVVRSPALRLHAGSTLALHNRYEIEPTDPTFGPYDRANVGVVDPATGSRTVVIPSGGQLYTLAPGAPAGTCGQTGQAGWNANSPGFPTFNQSTWNAAVFNPGGIFTNRAVHLEIRYGTDPGLHLSGFDFDQVVVTDFDDVVADAQPDACVPRLTFVAAASTVAENGGPAPVQVRMTTGDGANSTVSASVQFNTAPGTATAPGDYTIVSQTVTFNSGTPSGTTQTVNIPITNDSVPEVTESFTANLSGPVGGVLSGITTHTITITDDDALNFIRGDFNQDGKTDILWRHSESGQNVLWYMNGTVLAGGEFLTPAALEDTRWKMVGTHDFNADLKNDILWRHDTAGQNVLWYMNGSVLTSGEFLTPAALEDINWKMAGTGLFDADVKPDIAWHHQVAGQIVLWYMNGSVLNSGTFTTPPSMDINWRLVGVADFSSPLDNKPDFVWRHIATGENLIWFMNNDVKTGEATTTALSDTRWNIVATGDYNLDLKNDFVWRHSASGENVVWFMNGATLMSGQFTDPSSFPDVRWQMVGPR